MSKDIETEIMDDAEKRRTSTHSNFWALFYVWSIVVVFLAGVGGAVYWVNWR